MSVVSDEIRDAIVARAGGRCEYCRLRIEGQVCRFPVDHVIPRSCGGRTILENLALACPHCNAYKWAHVDGYDSETDAFSPLFNPRTQTWHDHFQWSPEVAFLLVGTTGSGRATIDRLQLNHPDLVTIRGLMAALGLEAR